jgi:AcrR family transcriptional regulator
MLDLSRRERKKLQVKNTIVEIALDFFFKKGFVETSVAEIMSVADLGTGTFYNYFGSKEEVLKYCISQKIREASKLIDMIYASEISARQKLTQILFTIGNTFEANEELFSLYMKFNRNNTYGEITPPHGPEFKEMIIKIIVSGQESNEFRNDIPNEIIVETLMPILQSSMLSTSSIPFKNNLNFKISLFLDGITTERGILS